MFSKSAIEMTKSVALQRDYECMKEFGGCGQPFKAILTAENLRQVTCVYCQTHGTETIFSEKIGRRVHKIQVTFPDGAPSMITDISGQDGRTNQSINMRHTLSSVREVSSRSGMSEALKRERDSHFEKTRGEHERMVPYRADPLDPTCPVVWEKETVTHEGFDLGELHPVESVKEVANRPKSSFDPGLTLDESSKRLEAKVGRENEGMELVPWEQVEKMSNRAFAKGTE